MTHALEPRDRCAKLSLVERERTEFRSQVPRPAKKDVAIAVRLVLNKCENGIVRLVLLILTICGTNPGRLEQQETCNLSRSLSVRCLEQPEPLSLRGIPLEYNRTLFRRVYILGRQ